MLHHSKEDIGECSKEKKRAKVEKEAMVRDNLLERTSYISIIFSVTIVKGLGMSRQIVGSKIRMLM